MSEVIIRVGIIDDDDTKRTQIIGALQDCVTGASKEVIEQYSKYKLFPVELTIQSDVKELLDEIIEEKIDALIIDYQLSSYAPNVNYTGVSVADITDQKFLGFPTFVLTSYESELYKHEVFDAYKVFDFERYMDEDKERIELNKKIIEQYVKRQREIENKKNELNELLKIEGTSQDVDDRILELDDFLERSTDGEYAISKGVKKRLVDDKFDEMITLLRNVVREK